MCITSTVILQVLIDHDQFSLINSPGHCMDIVYYTWCLSAKRLSDMHSIYIGEYCYRL